MTWQQRFDEQFPLLDQYEVKGLSGIKSFITLLIKEERLEEKNRILALIEEMKRWVATINGVDEYVVRDKDLEALKEKLV